MSLHAQFLQNLHYNYSQIILSTIGNHGLLHLSYLQQNI